MIGVKELGEYVYNPSVAGTLTTSSASAPIVIAINRTYALKGVIARLNTAGGTQATVVDILKSSAGGAFASIFSSVKINFATSSQTPTYGPFTTNPTTFVKGDVIKITVTQVGSGPAPVDLAVALLLCSAGGTKYPAATITDGF